MRVIFTFLLALTICINALIASGPSTYFNIYVPPNNDAVQRNVALIVTTLYDETSFTITDDGADGDADDSFSGTLSAGQSYILYIKDNGINDTGFGLFYPIQLIIIYSRREFYPCNNANLVKITLIKAARYLHSCIKTGQK